MCLLFRLGLALMATASMVLARPNIVLIVTDDLRADAIHGSGERPGFTPHLAALAAKGFISTGTRIQGSDQGAVCVASRAMLWSGQSLWRKNDQLSGRKTLGEILRENGYRTLGTGKWHNGDESLVRTFTEAVNITPGFLAKGHASPYPLKSGKDGTLSHAENVAGLHSSDLIGASAVELISGQGKGASFFLYVGFNAPHDPFDAPPSYLSLQQKDGAGQKNTLPGNFLPQPLFDHGSEINRIRDEKLLPKPLDQEAVSLQNSRYQAMLSQVDHWVGRIAEELKIRGLDEDTLVIFTADHGLARGSHGLLGKQNLYEHSLKVPMIIRGPGVVPGRQSRLPLYLSEIFPTLLDYAGCGIPEDQAEGISFRKIMEGGAEPQARATYHAYGGWMRAVIDGPLKLIEYRNRSGRFVRLYDIVADPLEMHDLSDDAGRANELERLRNLMRSQKEHFHDQDPIFWD